MTTIKMKKATKKQWIDAKGRIIPSEHVSDEVKYQEFVLDRIRKEAERINKTISEGKAIIEELNKQFLSMKAKQAGYDEWEGAVTLISFDGKFKMETKCSELITFGPDAQSGHRKIKEALETELQNVKYDVKEAILSLIEPSTSGVIPKVNLTKVKKWKLDSDLFREGIALFDSAANVTETKVYRKFYIREEDGSWTPLNVAYTQL